MANVFRRTPTGGGWCPVTAAAAGLRGNTAVQMHFQGQLWSPVKANIRFEERSGGSTSPNHGTTVCIKRLRSSVKVHLESREVARDREIYAISVYSTAPNSIRVLIVAHCSISAVASQTTMPSNKDRLYVALYARGGQARMPGGEDKSVAAAAPNSNVGFGHPD